MSIKEELRFDRFLRDATISLLRDGCHFQFCRGFNKEPEDMITCFACRSLYGIFNEYPEYKEDPDIKRYL